MPTIVSKRTRYAWLVVKMIPDDTFKVEARTRYKALLYFAPPGWRMDRRVGDVPTEWDQHIEEVASYRWNCITDQAQWVHTRAMRHNVRAMLGVGHKRFEELRRQYRAQFHEPVPHPWAEFTGEEQYYHAKDHELALDEALDYCTDRLVQDEYAGLRGLHAKTELIDYIGVFPCLGEENLGSSAG